VEPCKILYHGGFWYLVAMHDGTVKKFLLDFIEGTRATGRACEEIPESVRKTLSDAQSIWFQDTCPGTSFLTTLGDTIFYDPALVGCMKFSPT
jgi:predicted DNA-binding transcriptional regulator YafY